MIEYAMNITGLSEESIAAKHAEVAQVDTCTVCGLPLEVGEWPCVTRIRAHGRPGRLFNVIGDEIVGGFVQENFGPTPETFYSKRAMALRAKELNLQPFVRHKGTQDGDRSKHTSRWI